MSTMTVRELVEKLLHYPDNMPVYTEGCDCHGDAGSLGIIEDYDGDGIDAVMIYRASEKARLKYEQDKKERKAAAEKLAAEQRARGLIA